MSASNGSDTQGYLLVHFSREDTKQLLVLERQLWRLKDSEEAVQRAAEDGYARLSEELGQKHKALVAFCQDVIARNTPYGLSLHLQKQVTDDNVLSVMVLGRLGCDLHTRDSKGSSLLHMCTSSTMVHVLVDCGLDPRDRNDAGFTPLHLVSHIGAAKALLEHGADINDLNNARSTPLHFVEGPRMTRFLLSQGADPNAVNSYGHSPVHLISTKGMWEVVWCLLHAGSDPHICGRDGNDAERLAREVLNTVLPTDEAEGGRERRRLEQTIDLLSTWDKFYAETNQNFAATSELVKQHFTWKVHGALCKEPRTALLTATILPPEVMENIVVNYVGPFVSSGEHIKGARMAALRRRQNHRRASSSSFVGQLLEQAGRMGEDLSEQASAWTASSWRASPYLIGGAVVVAVAAVAIASISSFASHEQG